MRDGTVLRESEMAEGELAAVKAAIVRSRDIAAPEIEWFKICGDRVDEHKVWPGKYIPLVPWIGEEIVIENRMDRKGHTRAMIDAQRQALGDPDGPDPQAAFEVAGGSTAWTAMFEAARAMQSSRPANLPPHECEGVPISF